MIVMLYQQTMMRWWFFSSPPPHRSLSLVTSLALLLHYHSLVVRHISPSWRPRMPMCISCWLFNVCIFSECACFVIPCANSIFLCGIVIESYDTLLLYVNLAYVRKREHVCVCVCVCVVCSVGNANWNEKQTEYTGENGTKHRPLPFPFVSSLVQL